MKTTYTLSQIDQIAAILLAKSKSKLLLFKGDMGVGKTTLIKAIVKQLGSDDIVVSPTFSIVNEYQTSDGFRIYHLDLYRIEEVEDVFQIGFEDYLAQGDWILIEWPEIIADFLPEDCQYITLYQKGDKREVHLL